MRGFTWQLSRYPSNAASVVTTGTAAAICGVSAAVLAAAGAFAPREDGSPAAAPAPSEEVGAPPLPPVFVLPDDWSDGCPVLPAGMDVPGASKSEC